MSDSVGLSHLWGLNHNTPDWWFVLCKYKVQQTVSPCWLLDHWYQEVIANALLKHPHLLVLCCVVPPPDIGMVKVCIRTRACGCEASSVV